MNFTHMVSHDAPLEALVVRERGGDKFPVWDVMKSTVLSAHSQDTTNATVLIAAAAKWQMRGVGT